jgi:hypothetical protein
MNLKEIVKRIGHSLLKPNVLSMYVPKGSEERHEIRGRRSGQVSSQAPPKYKPEALPRHQPIGFCVINFKEGMQLVPSISSPPLFTLSPGFSVENIVALFKCFLA